VPAHGCVFDASLSRSLDTFNIARNTLYGIDSLMLFAFLKRLGIGASLIVAIGAQNAFVLRQGLLRQYVLTYAAICTLCDMVLINSASPAWER